MQTLQHCQESVVLTTIIELAKDNWLYIAHNNLWTERNKKGELHTQ